jgi:translation elongation factor P/translation initiation factor 5A
MVVSRDMFKDKQNIKITSRERNEVDILESDGSYYTFMEEIISVTKMNMSWDLSD